MYYIVIIQLQCNSEIKELLIVYYDTLAYIILTDVILIHCQFVFLFIHELVSVSHCLSVWHNHCI